MKGYDFEVLVDEINNNKLEAQKRGIVERKKQKQYKLRTWVKVALWTIFVAFISIAIYQLCTITKHYTTPVGSYQCRGGLIKVCSGSKEVADYLGV